MGNTVVTILFWLGVLLITGFVVAGLVSARWRALFQRPAEDMVRRDREQWGSRETGDDGGGER